MTGLFFVHTGYAEEIFAWKTLVLAKIEGVRKNVCKKSPVQHFLKRKTEKVGEEGAFMSSDNGFCKELENAIADFA